jgi:hypothetical protein
MKNSGVGFACAAGSAVKNQQAPLGEGPGTPALRNQPISAIHQRVSRSCAPGRQLIG